MFHYIFYQLSAYCGELPQLLMTREKSTCKVLLNQSSLWSGVLDIGEGSLIASNTIFRNNSTHSGPVITKTSPGRIT